MRGNLIVTLTTLFSTSTLVKTPFDFPTLDFFKESGIKNYRIPVPGHKDGQMIVMKDIAQIMRIMTNPCNQPMLIHCNKGKVGLATKKISIEPHILIRRGQFADYRYYSSTVLAPLSALSVDLPAIMVERIGLPRMMRFLSKLYFISSPILILMNPLLMLSHSTNASNPPNH